MISNSNFDSVYYKKIVIKEHVAGLEISLGFPVPTLGVSQLPISLDPL